MTPSPELRAAGFDSECDACHEAVARGWEACEHHYVPVHQRPDLRTCPTCGGGKAPADDVCDFCRASGAA